MLLVFLTTRCVCATHTHAHSHIHVVPICSRVQPYPLTLCWHRALLSISTCVYYSVTNYQVVWFPLLGFDCVQCRNFLFFSLLSHVLALSSLTNTTCTHTHTHTCAVWKLVGDPPIYPMPNLESIVPVVPWMNQLIMLLKVCRLSV